ADSRLVHSCAARNVLRRTAFLRPHRGHDAPLRDIQPKPLPVDPSQVLAHFSGQAIQAEGHKMAELQRGRVGFGGHARESSVEMVAGATIYAIIGARRSPMRYQSGFANHFATE